MLKVNGKRFHKKCHSLNICIGRIHLICFIRQLQKALIFAALIVSMLYPFEDSVVP